MIYTPTVPAVRQTDPWSCSVASAAFMLHSLGITASYPALEAAEVRDGIVSPALGLLDGSGRALADWLERQYGVTAYAMGGPVPWGWLLTYAGQRPIAIGSGSLYHWVAVRGVDSETLTLANPAPGYRGLGDTMTAAQFAQWAPWACVWIAVEEEAEDVGQIQDLENTLGYLQHDVADAFEAAIQTLEQTPRLPQQARDAVTGGLRPALETLRRGGPPSDGG